MPFNETPYVCLSVNAQGAFTAQQLVKRAFYLAYLATSLAPDKEPTEDQLWAVAYSPRFTEVSVCFLNGIYVGFDMWWVDSRRIVGYKPIGPEDKKAAWHTKYLGYRSLLSAAESSLQGNAFAFSWPEKFERTPPPDITPIDNKEWLAIQAEAVMQNGVFYRDEMEEVLNPELQKTIWESITQGSKFASMVFEGTAKTPVEAEASDKFLASLGWGNAEPSFPDPIIIKCGRTVGKSLTSSMVKGTNNDQNPVSNEAMAVGSVVGLDSPLPDAPVVVEGKANT